MSNYIVEAFKAMNLLESEDISLNQDGFEELKGFMDEAGVDPDEESTDVYDLEAEAAEDLKDSYVGKVVLECSVCHSDIFVDKAEISVGTDSEGLACYDIECPYCMSNEGFTIIGEIAPFNEEKAEELKNPEEEAPADDEIPAVDPEGAVDGVDEEDLEESLTEGCHKEEKLEEEMKLDGVEELYDNQEIRQDDDMKPSDKLEGSDDIRGPLHKKHVNEDFTDEEDKESFEEEIENELVHSGMNIGISYISDECVECDSIEDAEAACEVLNNAGYACYVEEDEDTGEKSNFVFFESLRGKENIKEALSATVTTDDQTISIDSQDDGSVNVNATPNAPAFNPMMDEPVEGGDEMIVPISDESVEEVEAAADANSVEDGEAEIEFEETEEENDEDEDFEDFDELSFNGLGESYLRECYENVVGFKTTGVSAENNKLMIEGIIKFDSGNIKETQFIFESVGDGKYEGYNKQISRGNKTYKLNTSINNKKLVCESLNYNYRSKNELNESVRVYGTVKRK